jgi:hypothetical protein
MTHSYKFVFSGTKIVILVLKYKVMEVDVLNKKVQKNSSGVYHKGNGDCFDESYVFEDAKGI